MLRQRLLVTIILIPLGLSVVHFGGFPFALLISAFLGFAAWEYCRMYQSNGHAPFIWLVTPGVVALTFFRQFLDWQASIALLSLLILGLMAYHLVAYERGRDEAGTDFNISVGGLVYLGLIGAFLISLRSLPDGKWWFLVVMPSVWFADSGAFFIGRRFGKHIMAPRLSPKKTWEGYFGGIFCGLAGVILLSLVWAIAFPAITVGKAAVIGLVMSVVTPLGDLGVSMLKRQFHMKDTGKLLPGHGGALDRIDSWVWGAILGYYLVLWLWI